MDRRDAAKRPAGTSLAVTYEGGDTALYDRIARFVDYLEISPDSISRATDAGSEIDRETLAELVEIGGDKQFLIHGVGLSIASADGWSEDYLRLLDTLFEHLPVAWHSEHLAYTMVGGQQLGTMLPPPRSQEALDLICERVQQMRRRYPVPFALEHVVRVLPDYPGTYSDADFLNALTREAGCEFIVDAYNLVCDRQNFAFDAEGFLAELDLTRAREMHVAGGGVHRGFRMDSHSRRADGETRTLAASILARAPNLRAVTFEFLKEAVPSLGADAICAELAALKEMLVHAEPR